VSFPRLKRTVFVLEALNGFAASLYFNYIFFFLRDHFGFGAKGNLLFCAANGLIYAIGAFYGGKIAQRRGYFASLMGGWAILIAAMALALLAGVKSIEGHWAAMIGWTLGVCVTWPCLEALSCEGESAVTLPRKVGIYNFVWSIAFAFGLFSGGLIMTALGWKSMFIIPALIHALQIGIVASLKNKGTPWPEMPGAPPQVALETHEADTQRNKTFLRMAWLANPFAYIAMNTVIPLIPQVAAKLGLSESWAGCFCSIWMFARTASFFALWKWTGWHYRFGWLIASYALMIGMFAAILLLTNLWLLVAAQIFFGFAVGLIYYSSLFYSMDASDAKGEHGGVHEAAIGTGIFFGPAIGYTALQVFPTVPNSSAVAVSAILTLGLGGLFYLRRN